MYFECIDNQRNHFKFYRMEVQLSLFGTLLLIRQWGRIGKSRFQQKRDEFTDLQQLIQQIHRLTQRRLRHNYTPLQTRLLICLPVDNYREEIAHTVCAKARSVTVELTLTDGKLQQTPTSSASPSNQASLSSAS
jgi:predicted DNA-binding WGR domain protein